MTLQSFFSRFARAGSSAFSLAYTSLVSWRASTNSSVPGREVDRFAGRFRDGAFALLPERLPRDFGSRVNAMSPSCKAISFQSFDQVEMSSYGAEVVGDVPGIGRHQDVDDARGARGALERVPKLQAASYQIESIDGGRHFRGADEEERTVGGPADGKVARRGFRNRHGGPPLDRVQRGAKRVIDRHGPLAIG